MDIDFVLPWVDGSDPQWQAEKERYRPAMGADASVIRYRDWGLLKYWFRAVEQFAPWVRTVHFITWGHLPPWLNRAHPKLHIVRHEDYIPAEYLPTFSCQPIELNINRIQSLAEHFVLFNDDMFLLKPVEPTLFFAPNGLPRDSAVLSPVIVTEKHDIGSIVLNNMCVINTYFSKAKAIHANPMKWFAPCYGKQLLRTLCLMPWRHFPGFFNDHLPIAFLKSTFDTLWEKEPELLHEVCTHRFREYSTDVNEWLMRYWQLCEGQFEPVSTRRGKDLQMASPDTLKQIQGQRYSMICINDSNEIDNFTATQAAYDAVFASVLYERSSFELLP
ncbi:MAG: Stealth CR1 domain-containing protein [Candidatus Limiplasma sp.]|nr:Stealth CR1 domain-containing protein [Candidatus Limiplasma sp.]